MIYLCTNEEILEQEGIARKLIEEVSRALDDAGTPHQYESSFRRWNGEQIRTTIGRTVAYTKPSEKSAAWDAYELLNIIDTWSQ